MKKDTTWIEQEASKIVSDVWNNNQEQLVFVTDKVAFAMRSLIKALRKNYWGIFDEPNDPITGRKKIWIPMTESTVEGVLKNIDLDTKDVNLRAKKPSAIGLTGLLRTAVKKALDEMGFGELLDESERQSCIDGTFIWKTIEVKKDGKYCAEVDIVDPLNFAIDPTAKNIQEASGVVERALVTKKTFDQMEVSLNKDNVATTKTASPNDSDLSLSTTSNAEMVEMFEYWGIIPKYLITGNKKDTEFINGRILTSGVSSFVVHEIEEVKSKWKPYEEFRLTKVNGRWHGKGIAEKIMMLQLWINTIVNIRINRSLVSQLGLFKVRKGSGITPQQLSKLGENGALEMTNLDDLQQLVIQEASQASYNDENNILSWNERVTNAFSIVTGEQLPSSTPATSAVLQNRNAQSGFTMVKEQLGMFLQRWIKRHLLPIVQKNLTKKEILLLTDSPEELKAVDEKIINTYAIEKLKNLTENANIVDVEQVLSEIENAKKRFEQMGNQRFFSLDENIDLTDYDVEIDITNENIDKAVAAQNLISVLQTVSQLPQIGIDPADVARQIFDLMGLTPPKVMKKQQINEQVNMLGNIGNKSVPQEMPNINMQSISEQANTLQ